MLGAQGCGVRAIVRCIARAASAVSRQLHRAHRHQDVLRRPPLPVAALHQRRLGRPAAPVFPKGTDLSRWSPADPETVANTLNNRPRKVLGYKTPAEVLNKQLQSMRPTFHGRRDR